MYRKIIVPDKKDLTIELPEQFVGKKIEVLAFEINEPEEKVIENKPRYTGKSSKDAVKNLAGAFPNFPSIEEIRKDAWPDRW